MGSKRAMLKNGLGDIISNTISDYKRFVDLFCGSASVTWHVAQGYAIPVYSVDLQTYSKIMASAITSRTAAVDSIHLSRWIKKSKNKLFSSPLLKLANDLENQKLDILSKCNLSKELCFSTANKNLPIWNSYGGYYFSPLQALKLDVLLRCLPTDETIRPTLHASLLIAASTCSASPGHTAQPFKPTPTAGKFLQEAWNKDPFDYAEKYFDILSQRHSKVIGAAVSGDANIIANELHDTDLVFIDPPYSGVHYSRFYHVLETIAIGGCSKVSGEGRYPPQIERPVSGYSRQTESLPAFTELMNTLSNRSCSAIITYPNKSCSNGLSGQSVQSICEDLFKVTTYTTITKFSTLGGNNTHRDARQPTEELILILQPK